MINCRERYPLHFFPLNYMFRLFACPKSQPTSDICMGDMWQCKATEENQDTSVKTTSETRDSMGAGWGEAFIIWLRRQDCRKQPPPLSNQPFEISSMPLNFSKKQACALQQLPSLLWPGQWKMASESQGQLCHFAKGLPLITTHAVTANMDRRLGDVNPSSPPPPSRVCKK